MYPFKNIFFVKLYISAVNPFKIKKKKLLRSLKDIKNAITVYRFFISHKCLNNGIFNSEKISPSNETKLIS